ncbi:iron ABC transporter permease, partial [Paenibacillus sepulcri]|nr:iron ABC transporter permease [Paenibacillus sepulcri]
MIKANNRNIGQGRLRPSLSPNFLGWLVSAILALLILYPLAAVMIQVVFPGVFFGDWNPGNLSLLLDVFSRPLWRQSMLNSLLLAGGTTVFATLLGGGLAMLRSSWSFPTARWLDLSVWVLLITPSFILAQGWVLFASSNGFAHKIFGWDWVTSLVFQPAGLVAIMVLSKFP